jgi:hypothetical protein
VASDQPALVSRPASRSEDAARVRALRPHVPGRSLEDLVQAFRDEQLPFELSVLRCGHYTTGKAPFKFIDGWILTKFLKKTLSAQA